jgi:hypothetical protein
MKKTLAKRTVKRSGEVVITTSRKKTSGDKELSSVEHTEHDSVSNLPPHPAYVEVNGGLTKNIGNYESIRIGVHVSVPCRPTISGIRKAHAKVSDLVAELIQLEYERAMEDEEL